MLGMSAALRRPGGLLPLLLLAFGLCFAPPHVDAPISPDREIRWGFEPEEPPQIPEQATGLLGIGQMLMSSPPGAPINTVLSTFTVSGTATAPAGAYYADIFLVGAGGSGSSGTNNATDLIGGGAGGAYTKQLNYSVTPGGTYAVVIGAGGVSPTTHAVGGNGGSTSFDAVVVAPGGQGGTINGVASVGGAGTFQGGSGAPASGTSPGAGGGAAGDSAAGGNGVNNSATGAGGGGGGNDLAISTSGITYTITGILPGQGATNSTEGNSGAARHGGTGNLNGVGGSGVAGGGTNAGAGGSGIGGLTLGGGGGGGPGAGGGAGVGSGGSLGQGGFGAGGYALVVWHN